MVPAWIIAYGLLAIQDLGLQLQCNCSAIALQVQLQGCNAIAGMGIGNPNGRKLTSRLQYVERTLVAVRYIYRVSQYMTYVRSG